MDRLKQAGQQFYEQHVKASVEGSSRQNKKQKRQAHLQPEQPSSQQPPLTSAAQQKEFNIVNIESLEIWNSEVVQSQVPIVLQCYADWCEKSAKLFKDMAELYKKSEGKWKYVRLNIELQPRLAQALQIQSLPVIALIHKQNLVDTLQTDAKQDLEKFMKVVNKVSGLEDEEGQIVSKLQLVHNYLAQSSNLNECFKILNSIKANEKFINKYGAQVHAYLALANSIEGNRSEVDECIKTLQTKYFEESKDPNVLQILESCSKNLDKQTKKAKSHPFISECEQILQSNPKDIQTRYKLAEYQFNNQLFQNAMDNLLIIIKQNRNWEGKKANTLILGIFEKLGMSSPLTQQYRKKLSNILF